MFNIIRAGAGRMPGRRKALFSYILGFACCIGFCAVLWAVSHYEFGLYLDRVHSRGGRLYRVNSYEQFIKTKTGAGPIALIAGSGVFHYKKRAV